MKPTEKQLEIWIKQAKIAYKTPAYDGSFERYWSLTGVLRIDAPTPYPTFWNDQKAVKQAAWDEEAIADGEGR